MRTVAILAASAFLIAGLVRWEDLNAGVNWGVVLLYAAAISLGVEMNATGAAQWVAESFLALLQPITLLSVAPEIEFRTDAEDAMAQACAMLQEIEIPVEKTMVEAGSPVKTIIEAGKDHDVIVVSDSGKSRLKRFPAGSVAFGVMGHSEISVLNVRWRRCSANTRDSQKKILQKGLQAGANPPKFRSC